MVIFILILIIFSLSSLFFDLWREFIIRRKIDSLKELQKSIGKSSYTFYDSSLKAEPRLDVFIEKRYKKVTYVPFKINNYKVKSIYKSPNIIKIYLK